ncbi:transposase [Puniceibacterium antarcticum]|uniref:Transposase n=1 Tax=Puniceibacterium antarcticum TaxID=1206336 RepID=A0A2G8R8I7_9RHOB|nr:transposase [Puniceibacterium antarcticum]
MVMTKGKSLLARGRCACGPGGVRASRLIWTADARFAASAPKIGCIPQTLGEWVKQTKKHSDLGHGVTSEERNGIEVLERKVRALRQANELLRKASACFAALSAM